MSRPRTLTDEERREHARRYHREVASKRLQAMYRDVFGAADEMERRELLSEGMGDALPQEGCFRGRANLGDGCNWVQRRRPGA